MLTSGLAWRVHPRNYLLFACHATNASAQTAQLARFVNYWHLGGREAKFGKDGTAIGDAKAALNKAAHGTKDAMANAAAAINAEESGIVEAVKKGIRK